MLSQKKVIPPLTIDRLKTEVISKLITMFQY